MSKHPFTEYYDTKPKFIDEPYVDWKKEAEKLFQALQYYTMAPSDPPDWILKISDDYWAAVQSQVRK